MWVAALASLLALACVLAAAGRARRLNALEDGRAFKDRMGHASLGRLGQLRDQLESGPGRELVEAVLDSNSERHAVSEMNTVVGDLKYELVGAHEVPKSAGRIAIAGGGMLAVVQLIQFLRGGATLTTVLVSLAAGLVGGLVCTALARSAQTRAREQLEAWNQVVRRLTEVVEQRFLPPKPTD